MWCCAKRGKQTLWQLVNHNKAMTYVWKLPFIKCDAWSPCEFIIVYKIDDCFAEPNSILTV